MVILRKAIRGLRDIPKIFEYYKFRSQGVLTKLVLTFILFYILIIFENKPEERYQRLLKKNQNLWCYLYKAFKVSLLFSEIGYKSNKLNFPLEIALLFLNPYISLRDLRSTQLAQGWVNYSPSGNSDKKLILSNL